MSEPAAIRTVEDLKQALARAHRHAEHVGRIDDPDLATVEGVSAVRVLADGRAEVITFGRGEGDDDIETFASEEAAVQELARILLQPAPPARSAAEQRASVERMQQVARDTLARLEGRLKGRPGADG